MQQLPPTTDCLEHSAHLVLDTVPPVIWFIRKQMRTHRKGLSLPQFRALAAVERQPEVSLSALADFLGASLPTASRIVGGLVDKGLLSRKGCSDDRRQLALAMTAAGRAVLSGAHASAERAIQDRLKNLPPASRKTLIDAMKILQEIFGSAGVPQDALPMIEPERTAARRAKGRKNPRALAVGPSQAV